MTSKQIDKFLRDTFGDENVHKINVSGCRFAKRGIADYYIYNRIGINGFGFWLETKTLKDTKAKILQNNFLFSVNGYKLRILKTGFFLEKFTTTNTALRDKKVCTIVPIKKLSDGNLSPDEFIKYFKKL
jgi:hydrogenase maturation factor HypE